MALIKSIQTRLHISRNWLNPAILAFLLAIVLLTRVSPFLPGFIGFDELFTSQRVNEMTSALLKRDWQNTVNNAYPAVTLMWLEAIRVQLLPESPSSIQTPSMEGALAALPGQRMGLALVNAMIIFAVYWLLRRLYNDFIAVAAMILMAFDPFLLFQTRLYRVEGLATGLITLSVITIILYAKEKKNIWLGSSGILAGLAILTKITAVYMFLFTGFILLIWPWLIGEGKSLSNLVWIVRSVFGWSLVVILTCFALWPTLWTTPAKTFGIMYDFLQRAATAAIWGEGGFFFQGRMMHEDPGVLFYLWSLAYRTTPMAWLGIAFTIIGAVVLIFRRSLSIRLGERVSESITWLNQHWPVTFVIFAHTFFYFWAMTLGSTKIDRYLLPVFPALSILAAVGFYLISNLIPVIILKNWLLLGALFIGSLFFALPYHPYYSTYWNPLLGGGSKAVKILPVVSNVGVEALIDHLNKFPNATDITLSGIGLDIHCAHSFSGNCVGQSEFPASDYFITFFFPIQFQATNLANFQSIVPDAELVEKFTKDGVDYAWLYKLPDGLQHVGQRIGQYGVLNGYRLSATEVGVNMPLEATLYWQNDRQGWQLEDSEFFIKLLDELGQVQQVALFQLKQEFIPSLSRPGDILVFTTTLNFDQDTSLGTYNFEIGLRLKETGEETWHFQLTDLPHTITVNRGALNISAEDLSIQHRLEKTIGKTGLTLLGYNIVTDRASPILYLYWQADKPPTENYTLNLNLLGSNEQIIATWSDVLSPETHPLIAWQSGEIVKLPFPLELGHKLPSDSYQAVLSVLAADTQERKAITQITLTSLPEGFTLIKPDVKMQHSLEHVVFDQNLDLLGYDLEGKGSSVAGTLFVTLYWLNRQPLRPVEAQIQVLDENGEVITQQILPVPPPTSSLTWQSVSHYELSLDGLPSRLIIKARPVGLNKWSPVDIPGKFNTEQIVIDDVLNKTTIVLE